MYKYTYPNLSSASLDSLVKFASNHVSTPCKRR
jgi:hypothetical protein